MTGAFSLTQTFQIQIKQMIQICIVHLHAKLFTNTNTLLILSEILLRSKIFYTILKYTIYNIR